MINNDAADALTRIPFINSGVTYIKITREYLSEIYCVNKYDGDTFT